MNKGKSKELEPTPPQAAEPQGQERRANGKTSGNGVRIASKQQFDKAHRKTSARHARLFRRLAT
jgi:hypothetical protein